MWGCDPQRRHMHDTQEWVVMTADNEQLKDTATKAFLPAGPKCPVPHCRSWPLVNLSAIQFHFLLPADWLLWLTPFMGQDGLSVCMHVMCISHKYTFCEWAWASYNVFLSVYLLQAQFCADAMKTVLLTKCGKNKHDLHFLISEVCMYINTYACYYIDIKMTIIDWAYALLVTQSIGVQIHPFIQ